MDASGPGPSLIGLLGTCLCMFLSALCCGLLPAVLPLKEAQLRTVNAVGAGLLIGSALCVILPEGFEAMHEAQEHAIEHGQEAEVLPGWSAGLALLLGFAAMLLLDGLAHSISGTHTHGALSGRNSDGGVESGDGTSPPEPHRSHNELQQLLEQQQQQQQDGITRERQLTSSCTARGAHKASGNLGAHSGSGPWNGTQQALLGLMVHALADGLAVGASSLARQPSVSMTVAVAMVLHKGPVAVGVASFLRGAGWPWMRVQQGLLAFALTSPLSALLTYLLLSNAAWLTSGAGVALAVLFSGGTFLYASCIHIFPSVFDGDHDSHAGGKSHATLLALCAGMFLPLLLSASMPHHHH